MTMTMVMTAITVSSMTTSMLIMIGRKGPGKGARIERMGRESEERREEQ